MGTGDKQYACARLPANIHCTTVAQRQHLARASSVKAFASKAKAIAAATRGGGFGNQRQATLGAPHVVAEASIDSAWLIQSIYQFNVLGGNWDPPDKKFTLGNSCRQNLLPTCTAFPKETTTWIWFTQSHDHRVCNGTAVPTVLQGVQML